MFSRPRKTMVATVLLAALAFSPGAYLHFDNGNLISSPPLQQMDVVRSVRLPAVVYSRFVHFLVAGNLRELMG